MKADKLHKPKVTTVVNEEGKEYIELIMSVVVMLVVPCPFNLRLAVGPRRHNVRRPTKSSP